MSLVGNFTQNADYSSRHSGATLHRTTSSSQPIVPDPLTLGTPISDRFPTLKRLTSRSSQNQDQDPNYSPNNNTAHLPPTNEYDEFLARPEEPSQTMDQTLASRNQQVSALARHMSRMSSSATAVNPFEYDKDSDFDPFSEKFDVRKWTRHVMHFQEGGETAKGRRSGVSFRNLGVHGFGSDAGESFDSTTTCRADRQTTKRMSQISRFLWSHPLETPLRVENAEYRSCRT